MKRPLRLRNPVLDYAWGSRTAIAELLGQPAPSPGPQAELWLGAHPKAPSELATASGWQTLDTVIAADPPALLGAELAQRFDGQLPFLLKVLAAAEPLSIQAHPSALQARVGFAREEAAGVARDARERNYRDPHSKPELICALTPFSALVGLRPLEEVEHLLGSLELDRLRQDLAGVAGASEGARAVALWARLLSMSREDQQLRVTEARLAVERLEVEAPLRRWVAELARRYPKDAGALAPLLLNLMLLQPGEALALEAGVLHAYLDGLGIEVMANSDNVLRGGLTSKHVDTEELLRVLEPRVGRPALLCPEPDANGERRYRSEAPQFALASAELRGDRPLRRSGAKLEILLCLAGPLRLQRDGGEVWMVLAQGESALVPAGVGPYRVTGSGRLIRAFVPGGSL